MKQSLFQEVCEIKAPGKAILCGEHAVVYGQDAIAMGIGLYCRCILKKRLKKGVQGSLTFMLDIEPQKILVSLDVLLLFDSIFKKQNVSHEFQVFDSQFLSMNKDGQLKSIHERSLHFKLGLLLSRFNIKWRQWVDSIEWDYLIQIQSQIPLGKCLGSSAAFNTTIATAFLLIFKREIYFQGNLLTNQTKEIINELSVLFQRVEHGNPSGIDNFVAVHGGLILFNRFKEPKFTSLSHLAHKFKELFDVAIADSKIEKNTKVAVDMVKKRCLQSQQDQQNIKRIGQICKDLLTELEKENVDSNRVFALIQANHQILKEFGLSHKELERLRQMGLQNGWIGKITGSGMGGCLLLLSQSKKGKLNQEICLARLDEEGLKISFSGTK